MAQTKTSFANRSPDAGLTLIEMLAALAIAATLTSFVAMSLAGGRGDRTLDAAASQLAGDLRAARTHALRDGEPIRLVPTSSGYTIAALSIDRQWASGMDVRWQATAEPGRPIEGFTFTPGRLAQGGLEVTLTGSGGATRAIQVSAMTGRVDAR